MTQADFAKGWRLLIIQPWGWRYNQTDHQGRPTRDAQTQLEFYYNQLHWADSRAWWKTCEQYAQGKEWPSVSELRQAVQHLQRQVLRSIRDTRKDEGEPMPDDVRAMIDRLGRSL